MSYTTRFTAPLSLLLLVAVVLAACGNPSPAPPPAAQAPTTVPTTVPTAAPTRAPTVAPKTATPSPVPPTSLPEPTPEPPTPEPAPPTPEPVPNASAVPDAPATGDSGNGIAGAGADGTEYSPLGYPILATPNLEFGAAAHLFYTDAERVMILMQNAGFDWVRQQIHWRDIEWKEKDFGWEQLDHVVDTVDRAGLKLLISIVRSPSFYTADGSDGLPADPTKLGDFVEAMALRYGDKIAAYQIWNEQNLAHETGGTISFEDAGRYVETLIEAYTRIKAVNPKAYVVTGALSPTGHTDWSVSISDIEYLRAMYEYRGGIIRGYFDVQAAHAAGSANPPSTLYPDNPSNAAGWTNDATFYFRNIENVRREMEAYGMDGHQLWVTEFGWATQNETPGYEYGNLVSYEQQGEYIREAVLMSHEKYPWLGALFVWNMNFAVTWNETNPPQPFHEQASFGILNPDWSPRPAYLALQDTIHAIKRADGR